MPTSGTPRPCTCTATRDNAPVPVPPTRRRPPRRTSRALLSQIQSYPATELITEYHRAAPANGPIALHRAETRAAVRGSDSTWFRHCVVRTTRGSTQEYGQESNRGNARYHNAYRPVLHSPVYRAHAAGGLAARGGAPDRTAGVAPTAPPLIAPPGTPGRPGGGYGSGQSRDVSASAPTVVASPCPVQTWTAGSSVKMLRRIDATITG